MRVQGCKSTQLGCFWWVIEDWSPIPGAHRDRRHGDVDAQLQPPRISTFAEPRVEGLIDDKVNGPSQRFLS